LIYHLKIVIEGVLTMGKSSATKSRVEPSAKVAIEPSANEPKSQEPSIAIESVKVVTQAFPKSQQLKSHKAKPQPQIVQPAASEKPVEVKPQPVEPAIAQEIKPADTQAKDIGEWWASIPPEFKTVLTEIRSNLEQLSQRIGALEQASALKRKPVASNGNVYPRY
jgi:hypothetical protein